MYDPCEDIQWQDELIAEYRTANIAAQKRRWQWVRAFMLIVVLAGCITVIATFGGW